MLDRKTPPEFVHSTSFNLIKPEKQKLPNNIDLFLVRGGDQDVLKVECIFKAGRWYEEYLGASHFTSNLINKGTKSKNSFAIAQSFDRYGAHLEIQPGQDFVSIAVYGLTKYLQPALDLLFEIISEPTFPEKEFDQSKSIFLQNLKVNEEKTSYLASKAFRKKLFGENHPYGKELEETPVISLGRNQIVDHYNKFFKDLSIIVSGKFDDQAVTQIASKFSSLKTSTPKFDGIVINNQGDFHERIAKKGSVQCSIRAGRKSIMRNHPDYAAVIFTGHLLGGYFGSRLMKNIREEKGLTYGIYASVHPLQHDSYLVIGADVNNENFSLTMDEIRKELKQLRTDRVGNEELHTAKNHFIGSLQSEITTSFAHADKIKTIYLSSLPQDFYQDLITKIDSISTARIMEVSEKYFHEDTISEVAVG